MHMLLLRATNTHHHHHPCLTCPPCSLLCPTPCRRSVDSIACESYLIVRPGGNVMVDTPRFNPILAKRLQELGGVKYMFLTHKVNMHLPM